MRGKSETYPLPFIHFRLLKYRILDLDLAFYHECLVLISAPLLTIDQISVML